MNCDLNAGMRFAIIGRFFRHEMDEAGAKNDLTGVQMMVMGQLHKLESSGMEEIRQRDLEKAAHLGHPTMTEIIKRLEKKGFVECGVSRTDRRSKAIRSTPRAHALHLELEEVDRRVFDSLCQGMDEGEQQRLLSAMDLMLKNAFTTMGKEMCHDSD